MFIEKLVTVSDVVPAKLPTELRKTLSTEDLKAIKLGPVYFDKLAQKAQYGWLKEMLKNCAACGGWQLQFYAINRNPYVPYFRFSWGGNPALCLRRDGTLPRGLPQVLRHFYSLLDAFQENEFGYAGGVLSIREHQAVGDMGIWIADQGSIDPHKAKVFLETHGGEFLCYLRDGSGVWYSEGRLKPVDSIEAEIARYFGALLEGTRI